MILGRVPNAVDPHALPSSVALYKGILTSSLEMRNSSVVDMRPSNKHLDVTVDARERGVLSSRGSCLTILCRSVNITSLLRYETVSSKYELAN